MNSDKVVVCDIKNVVDFTHNTPERRSKDATFSGDRRRDCTE